jgi:hypothetical protein
MTAEEMAEVFADEVARLMEEPEMRWVMVSDEDRAKIIQGMVAVKAAQIGEEVEDG